jgi:hypothetical protein
MKKVVLVMLMLVSVVVCSPAFGEVSVDTQGLTDTQKAELVKQAAAMKQAASVSSPEKVAQWVDVGKNAGLAFASFAKEVGVAGDKFIESTTGKLVFGAIAFKMIGGPLIHFGAGFLVLAICIPIWVWSYRKEFEYLTKFDKETGKVISIEAHGADGEKQFIYFIVGAMIIGVSLISMFTF